MVFWKRGAKGDDIRELPQPNSDGRPKLKAAFTQELQASVRHLEESHHEKATGRFGFFGSTKSSPFRSDGGRPRLSKEQKDELRLSVHNLMAKRETVEPSESKTETIPQEVTSENRRPTLDQNIADELKNSFRQRDARNDARREEIRRRMMERRESKRQLESQLYPHSISEEDESEHDLPSQPPQMAQHQVAPNTSGERPKLRPELFDELKKSIHSKSTRNFDRRQQIRERLMQRRESQRIWQDASTHSNNSDASFAEGQDSFSTDLPPRLALKGKKDKATKWDQSVHSTETFANASFSDMGDTEHGPGFKPAISSPPINERDEDEDAILVGEWDKSKLLKIIRDNKRLKSENDSNMTKISVLTRQVDDLKAESTDLRKQLSNWQEKASSISRRQSEDRQKFENSSDLMTKARVELTKALNENVSLKSRLHEVQLGSESQERAIRILNETIENQSEKISMISAQLKDTEAELQFNSKEKHRIEEELAVLVATRDDIDITETIRRLEQDKAKWLEEKDRALEAKRMAIDEENDRLLERDRQRYRREAEQFVQTSNKVKDHVEEHKRLQDAITRQLKELKSTNDDLRDKLSNEHLENRVQTRKKDHTITLLEQEVSKLRRKLAGSQLREQDLEAQLSDIQNKSDELQDAKRQISVLEKQIKKLKKEKPQQHTDWREIILPGYKHLRGVTFGDPSADLAGFLTILVEDQKAKQSEVKSHIQQEIQKYFKEAQDKVGSSKSSSSPSKAKKDVKTARSKRSSNLKKKSATKKRKTNPSAFTDIEDYDWAVKPSKTMRAVEAIKVNESSSSDDDTSSNHNLKRLQKRSNKTKQKKKSHTKKKEKPTTMKKTTKYRRRQEPSVKRKEPKNIHHRPKRKLAGRRISRRRSMDDDNIELVERKSNNYSAIDPDDISLVVIKRTHANKEKKMHGSNVRRRRLPPVTPPATIILQ